MRRLLGFLGGAKLWVGIIAVLLVALAASGWALKHSIEAGGRLANERDQALATAEAYKRQVERAEAAARTAQAARERAEQQKQQALTALARLEQADPDVQAWSSRPVPPAVRELLHQNRNDQ